MRVLPTFECSTCKMDHCLDFAYGMPVCCHESSDNLVKGDPFMLAFDVDYPMDQAFFLCIDAFFHLHCLKTNFEGANAVCEDRLNRFLGAKLKAFLRRKNGRHSCFNPLLTSNETVFPHRIRTRGLLKRQ